jgi:hypothetical protein
LLPGSANVSTRICSAAPWRPACSRSGMDITDLQRFLGHDSIATTRLYAETTS